MKKLKKTTNKPKTGGVGEEGGETLKGLQRRNLPGQVNPDRKQHVS